MSEGPRTFLFSDEFNRADLDMHRCETLAKLHEEQAFGERVPVMTYRLNATAPWDIDVVEALAGSSRSDTHETLAAQAVVEEMWVPMYSKIEVLASFVFVCVLFDVTRTYGAKGDGSLAMIGEYHLRLIILVVICAKELLEETVQLVDLAQRNHLCFF